MSFYVLTLSFGMTFIGTFLVRRWAVRARLLDQPNSRSSHATPTPRAGGVAIVLAAAICWFLLFALGSADGPIVAVLVGGGIPIALVGLIDDLRTVSPRRRFAVHVACTALAVTVFRESTPVMVGSHSVDLGIAWPLLASVGLAWFINLYNFMDGIDGIAGVEAVSVLLVAVALVVFKENGSGIWTSMVLAASVLGFLIWNWHPAKIFMGDVGSGFLGYSIGVIAVASIARGELTLWTWLILTAVFTSDATVTLVRRVLAGRRPTEAHRTHAYQILSRRFGSHSSVSIGAGALNLLWLAPLAAVSENFREFGAIVAAVALLPVIAAVWLVGAGRES